MRQYVLAAAFFAAFLLMFAGTALSAGYVIGEGDTLDIAVWGVKDLTFSVKVRPDGKITVPGIGEVEAAELEPKSLQDSLSEKLRQLVKNPVVTVSVRETTNSKVYVFGGGVPSGVFDLSRRTTLLQLLCVIGSPPDRNGAGATAPAASAPDYRRGYLLRRGEKIKEDFHNLFINGKTEEDVVIEAGDALYIPKLVERYVYVLGAVNSPRYVEFREGMTVMEAILESGGFTKFARQNETSIIRKEGEKETVLTVRARDLVKGGDLTQNLKLKCGDYIIAKEGIF